MEEIEKAFDLIKKGNKLEKSEEFWNASKVFIEASQLLQHLSETKKDVVNREEDEKKSKLFHEKSKEYLIKAQTCLVKALQSEINKEENSCVVSDSECSKIDQSEISKINNQQKAIIFQQNFAPIVKPSRVDTLKSPTDLEQRLKDLNDSLPLSSNYIESPKRKEEELEIRLRQLKNLPGSSIANNNLPTSDRLNQIHEGMDRLGIHVNRDDEKNNHKLLGFESISDEDQLKQILSFVKDEIELERFDENNQEKTSQRINTKLDADKNTTPEIDKIETNEDDINHKELDDSIEDEDDDDETVLSNDEIHENAIDLIYKAQDLLMSAASILDGEDISLSASVLEDEEETHKKDNEVNAQKKSQKVLTRANTLIDKVIKSLNK